MSKPNYLHRRLMAGASVVLAGLTFAAPAFAADTTVTIAVGVAQATAVTASPAAGDTYTINVLGTLRNGLAGNIANASVQGSGAGSVVVNNNGRLQGRFDFPAASGPITLHNNTGGVRLTTGWTTTGVSTFGSGADLIDNSATGLIEANTSTTFAFGGGNDRIVNAGMLVIDGEARADGVLTFTGLETFQNSGLILLGSYYSVTFSPDFRSDQLANDRLNAQGVAFTGSGASRIGMDVTLGSVAQTSCVTLTAADCVDFTGGSTSGSTLLTIRDSITSGSSGLNSGIVLVVGSSAASDFTLDPNSDDYVRTSRGGGLQKQLVVYELAYDAANKKHMLVGVLADEAYQGSTFATSAQETWRATTGSWFDRQADLRAMPGGLGTSSGIWARAGAGQSERELQVSGAPGYSYNLDHKQKNAHAVVGADMLRTSGAGGAAVVGGMVGFVRSDIAYDATPTEATSTGFTGGLYASYVAGPLFVDGVFNVNLLKLKADVPNMGLGPDVPLTQEVRSLGGQLEAGWRIAVGADVFVEPLAGVSYVRTRIEDIDVPGGAGTFDFDDDYTSLRAGAGLRAGMDSQLLGMAASFSLTGRYWNELEGQNGTTVLVTNGATSTAMMDDFSGGFGEVAGALNLFSGDGGVSGFANLGGRFADGYRSVDASVGVRVRW